MIKYCFAYFNKLGDFYGQPFFVDHDKKMFPKALSQMLYGGKKDELIDLRDDDLYFIGSFDNETGVFSPEKEFITSMSGMVNAVLVKKFGEKEDVGQA